MQAGRLLRARPTLVIFTVDTSSFSPWAVLWRGISFYFSSPNLVLEEIFPSSPTRHPWRRLHTTARLESVSNCPETLNCARRSIKWIGWDAMAGHWVPRTFTPTVLMVSMRLLACDGLSADMDAREPQQPINPAIHELCALPTGKNQPWMTPPPHSFSSTSPASPSSW